MIEAHELHALGGDTSLNFDGFSVGFGAGFELKYGSDSIGLDIGYSGSPDSLPPQITQVGAVKTAPATFKAFMRVTDANGFGSPSGLNRVAVLYTTGDGTWTVKLLTNAGGDLWTGTIPAGADSIRLDGEAQDNAGNVGFSFNKAVNFQSVTDTGKPTITIDSPLPNAAFTLNQHVDSSFFCSDLGGVASCSGKSDARPANPTGSSVATDAARRAHLHCHGDGPLRQHYEQDRHLLRRGRLHRLQVALSTTHRS